MHLSGRIAAAIEVLADMEARKRPTSEALRDWGLSHRFAGSGDRAAIGNLVYDAQRRRASHAFAMGEDAPRALVLSVAVRDWGEAPETLNAAFAADRFAPTEITSEELARLSEPDPLAGASDHVRADLPEWIVPQFQSTFGEQWVTEGQGLAARPPLDLRVNGLKSDVERVQKSLRRFQLEPAPFVPLGLRLPVGARDARTPNVLTDEGFLKGWFEVQDAGSQIVAALTGAAPGEQVLDFCAGAGGKTLAMAAAMQNKGQIFAHDSDRSRLAPIYDRLQRAGVRNAQVRPPEPDALDNLVGKMDRVVVDAPCTGTGTWRRRPDAKWRLTPDQIAARTAEQAAILDAAARYVRPGGMLVYITCSLLAAENAETAGNFAVRRPDFAAQPIEPVWQMAFPATPLPAGSSNEGLYLSPARTGTDGFFITIFVRAKG